MTTSNSTFKAELARIKSTLLPSSKHAYRRCASYIGNAAHRSQFSQRRSSQLGFSEQENSIQLVDEANKEQIPSADGVFLAMLYGDATSSFESD
ncbi:predicted protein [Sclerotinia sclerotiorum 1980 UF-70]|uniref:Uncharacterized protein n=1 Tax=Sclerotinia sclerotiorum (strain ATCC 18683 / 1980 / Ss-1) TaxID=665079 RepID=A7F3Y3_SCLS1|nr:predicted protein [Sclerotinia sclerotiorum 1980 UF-70]EDN97454.1 predicted protein [Sclerotinia sclerotiorum 1980 UF-70]